MNANYTTHTGSLVPCDCHVHVFDKPEIYPYENTPAYEPPYAPASRLLEIGKNSGIQRFVVVQPTPYGQNHALLLETLRSLGGEARGVGVANASTSLEDLERLHKAGIRGLRFIESRFADGTPIPGAVPVATLVEALAPMLAEIGMHAEIWAPLPVILSFWPELEKCGIPLVLDHMGGYDSSLGPDHQAFKQLVDLVRNGAVSVKLVLCRRIIQGQDFGILRAFHDALINANVRQLLWGTDCPFVRYAGTPPTVTQLLTNFRNWVNDPLIEREILIENPNRLYWR